MLITAFDKAFNKKHYAEEAEKERAFKLEQDRLFMEGLNKQNETYAEGNKEMFSHLKDMNSDNNEMFKSMFSKDRDPRSEAAGPTTGSTSVGGNDGEDRSKVDGPPPGLKWASTRSSDDVSYVGDRTDKDVTSVGGKDGEDRIQGDRPPAVVVPMGTAAVEVSYVGDRTDKDRSVLPPGLDNKLDELLSALKELIASLKGGDSKEKGTADGRPIMRRWNQLGRQGDAMRTATTRPSLKRRPKTSSAS
jgi:hypothetical protein